MSYTKLTDFAVKDSLLSGNPAKVIRGTEIDAEFNAIAASDAQNITPTSIVAATSKATPVDADLLPLVDSAASNTLKKLTWANLKATAKTYFDTLYLGISATATNASQLLGKTWASPDPIGSTTPSTGAFTSLSTSGNVTLGASSTDTLNVGNGGLIKDAAGNVGIGVTPSAWSGALKAVEGFGGSFVASQSGLSASFVGTNTYFTGAWIYKTTGGRASYFEQYDGTFKWNTAPSGTAGAPISFMRSMTLTADVKLLLNQTDNDTGWRAQISSGGLRLNYDRASYSSIFGFLSHDGDGGGVEIGNINNLVDRSIRFSGGTSYAGRTEYGRFDSLGNLFVGSTATNVNANALALYAGAGTVYANHLSGAAPGTGYAFFNYNGSTIGSITQNGTTAVTFNTTSDHRLKENVRAADAARFMDIQFRDFEWVDGRHDCGVIAHELQQVYPDLVLGEKDATDVRTVEITPAVPAVLDAEGNETAAVIPAVTEEQTFPVYQQVNYTGLIGRMGTRVQSQQRTIDAQAALIEAMELRLTALEANV